MKRMNFDKDHFVRSFKTCYKLNNLISVLIFFISTGLWLLFDMPTKFIFVAILLGFAWNYVICLWLNHLVREDIIKSESLYKDMKKLLNNLEQRDFGYSMINELTYNYFESHSVKDFLRDAMEIKQYSEKDITKDTDKVFQKQATNDERTFRENIQRFLRSFVVNCDDEKLLKKLYKIENKLDSIMKIVNSDPIAIIIIEPDFTSYLNELEDILSHYYSSDYLQADKNNEEYIKSVLSTYMNYLDVTIDRISNYSKVNDIQIPCKVLIEELSKYK